MSRVENAKNERRAQVVQRALHFAEALALLLLIVVLDSLDRYRIAPAWLPESGLAVVILVVAVATLTNSQAWRRIELVVLWVAVLLALGYNVFNLYSVTYKMVFQAVEASKLFYTALAIWITNVLAFSVLYWLLDGGGPDARGRGGVYPDFDFPASDVPQKVKPGWQPGVVDYLFLGFTTATAFSPTEAQPLTARAKLLMIAEGLISLTTVAIVGARAINIIK